MGTVSEVEEMAVYLIHFEERLWHAGHYLGYSANLAERIQAHRASRGARLMEVVNELGIRWQVVRVWPEGGYELERALKARHNGPRLCPVCNPRLAEELAVYPASVGTVEPELLDVDAFSVWLERWKDVEVGWSDEPLACPVGNWLSAVYGGEWQVNARSYRWRENAWRDWQEWQALPPWAVTFLDRLYQRFGNAPVLGWQVAEVVRWSLVDVERWGEHS